jgi:heptosyltransferase-2
VVARPPGPVEHRVRDFLLLAEALGAGPFTAAHFAPVAAAAAPPPRSLAVVPDSDFGSSHAWPAARWCDVLAGWSGQGNLRPTIIDRGDGPVAAELAAALGGSAVCERTQSLADDLILLGRHRFVAAVDGTAPHLAAHLGATCLVLFGPNDPAWRRPLGKRHLVVRRHVECAPCLRPQCPLDHRCMHELGAAQVLDALTNLPGWQAAEDQAGAG